MAAPGPDEKTCPMCAEHVKAAAVRCRFCHHDFTGPARPLGDRARRAERTADGISSVMGRVAIIAIAILAVAAYCTSPDSPTESTGASFASSERPVDPADVMNPEQRQGCRELLNKVNGPRQLVDQVGGIARVDRKWWGSMTSNDQAQLINFVACAEYGVRLPALRGLHQVVIIKDSASGDVLASAADGQLMR